MQSQQLENPRVNDSIADTSQHGECQILLRIFDVMGINNGYAVEFGAWDGRHLSNAYPFLMDRQWDGLVIEADPHKFADLRKTYGEHRGVRCLNQYVEKEGPNSLDNLLERTGAPLDIDLVSIDIDGFDYQILKSISKYVPKTLVVEYNPTFPAQIQYIQPESGRPRTGSSASALVTLAFNKGLRLHAITPTNLIFVRKDIIEKWEIATTQLNDGPTNPYVSYLCQAYDGTLILEGNRKLLWHGLRIHDDSLQVLPRVARRYPDESTLISRIAFWSARQFHRLRGRNP